MRLSKICKNIIYSNICIDIYYTNHMRVLENFFFFLINGIWFLFLIFLYALYNSGEAGVRNKLLNICFHGLMGF